MGVAVMPGVCWATDRVPRLQLGSAWTLVSMCVLAGSKATPVCMTRMHSIVCKRPCTYALLLDCCCASRPNSQQKKPEPLSHRHIAALWSSITSIARRSCALRRFACMRSRPMGLPVNNSDGPTLGWLRIGAAQTPCIRPAVCRAAFCPVRSGLLTPQSGDEASGAQHSNRTHSTQGEEYNWQVQQVTDFPWTRRLPEVTAGLAGSCHGAAGRNTHARDAYFSLCTSRTAAVCCVYSQNSEWWLVGRSQVARGRCGREGH